MRLPVTLAAACLVCAGSAVADPLAITVDTTRTVATFSPLRAIGAGVDAQPTGTIDQIYAPSSVKGMLSVGFGSLTYRLNTELNVQHWHWNPAGTFSDPSGSGYWTSSATPTATPIARSWGFALPHRGFTRDPGWNESYSMLTDGDPTTYWKSNPYLASRFTGEPDADHPQWIVVDLGKDVPVDAINIKWGDPYAATYRMQHWVGRNPMRFPARGQWQDFRVGDSVGGGTVLTHLAVAPITTRFIRVVMAQSSGTCSDAGPGDPRNCVGFAVRELGVGTLSPNGTFHDVVLHRASQKQTVTYVSSVDPWHAAGDQADDPEQAGLDLVLQSGLTRGLPTMVPVGLLYSTPEDAAAELTYLEAQHYPIGYVELGEEPDGQFMSPEDYGALYLQWATALKAVDPNIKLGGPSFQGAAHDIRTWANFAGEKSWLKRFLAYLSSHGRSADFSFFSFEHYPDLACDVSQSFLESEPFNITSIMAAWRDDGIAKDFPTFITEANLAANGNSQAQTIDGALWYADWIGSSLRSGITGAYFYEYEPVPLSSADPCPGIGTYSSLAATDSGTITQRLAPALAAKLITQHWAQPVDQPHLMHPAPAPAASDGTYPVSAYAVERPDGSYALLLVNRDLAAAHDVTLSFRGAGGARAFAGAVALTRLDTTNYAWVDTGTTASYAAPDGPLAASWVTGGAGAQYSLPAASVTVMSGMLSR